MLLRVLPQHPRPKVGANLFLMEGTAFITEAAHIYNFLVNLLDPDSSIQRLAFEMHEKNSRPDQIVPYIGPTKIYAIKNLFKIA